MSSTDSESESGRGEEEEGEEEEEARRSSEGEEQGEEEEEEEEEEAEEQEEDEEEEGNEEEDEEDGEDEREVENGHSSPARSTKKRKSSAVANGSSRKPAKSAALTTLAFPISRVRRLVKSEVEVQQVGVEAGFLIAKAALTTYEVCAIRADNAEGRKVCARNGDIRRFLPSNHDVVVVNFERDDPVVAALSVRKELFLEKFVEDAFDKMTEDERTVLSYKDLASHVNSTDKYDFLGDFIPETVPASIALSVKVPPG